MVQLTDDQAPCRVLFWMLSADPNSGQPNDARDAGEDEQNEMVFALVDAAVAPGEDDVELVAQPARVEHGAEACWDGAGLEDESVWRAKSMVSIPTLKSPTDLGAQP